MMIRELVFVLSFLSMPAAAAMIFGATIAGIVGSPIAATDPGALREPIGGALYAENCAACHGAAAEGAGGLGPTLLLPAYAEGAMADAEIARAILEGRRAHLWAYGDMPAILGLGAQEIDAVIAHLRALQRGEAPES